MLIGLTGCMCSGKSYVEKILKQQNINVLDMDELTRQAYTDSTNTAYQELVDIFGIEILDCDGCISKVKMRELFVAGYGQTIEHKLKKHVTDSVIKLSTAETENRFCVFSSSLIHKIQLPYDAIWGVLADECLITERIKRRDPQRSYEEFCKLRARQVSDEWIVTNADEIIINNYDADILHTQVLNLIDRYS